MKNTDESHGDFTFLLTAIQKMTECAEYQDKKIEETNNRVRVNQLSKKLKIHGLAQEHRKIVREGRIRINQRKKLTKVYLFNDTIVLRDLVFRRWLAKKYSLRKAYIRFVFFIIETYNFIVVEQKNHLHYNWIMI